MVEGDIVTEDLEVHLTHDLCDVVGVVTYLPLDLVWPDSRGELGIRWIDLTASNYPDSLGVDIFSQRTRLHCPKKKLW